MSDYSANMNSKFPVSYLSVSFCHFDLAFSYILAYLAVSIVAFTLVDIDFLLQS